LGDAPSWTAVLDDLEVRLAAAEHGDIDRLNGWTAPVHPGPMTPADAARAGGILARQQALIGVLTERRRVVGERRARIRKRAFVVAGTAPVYVDRAL